MQQIDQAAVVYRSLASRSWELVKTPLPTRMPGWCTKVRFADYGQGRRTVVTARTSQQASYQSFVSERYFRLPQQARGSPATGRTRQTAVENYKLSDLLHWIGRFLCRETLVNPQLAKYLRRYQLTGTFQGSASVGRVGRVQIREMLDESNEKLH